MKKNPRLDAIAKQAPALETIDRIERVIHELDGTIVEKYVRVRDTDGIWHNHFEILVDGHWVRKD